MSETTMIPFGTGEGLSAGVGGAIGSLLGSWFGNGWNGFGTGWGNRGGVDMVNVGNTVSDAVLAGSALNEISNISDQINNVNTTLLQSQATQNSALCQGFSGVNEAIYRTSANTDQNLCAGFANMANVVQNGDTTTRFENMSNFSNLASQLADCCCKTQTSLSNGFGHLALENCHNTGKLVNMIGAEGAATRALINQNYINDLQSQLCDAKAKISSLESQAFTSAVIANQSQVFDQKLNNAVSSIISHVRAFIPETTTTAAA